jgi:putative sigma-54 modulation protein
MRLSTILAASLLTSTAAFAPNAPLHLNSRLSPLAMSTEAVNYVITGNNIEVTDSLTEYVNKKLDKTVGKLAASGSIKECDVHFSVNKNPKVKKSQTCEVVTYVKGTVIRCAEDSEDMYASIDAVTDRLAQKLKKYKQRRLDGFHGGPNMGENLAAVLDAVSDDVVEDAYEADEFIDPEAPIVTKVKSYDLSKSISIEEAVFALGYVDHDFYVFREEKSGDINVVYKRNAGGYGLIGPQ